MPKQSQRASVNAFVKGIITEASPLSFPANASIDEQNFELNTDGTRSRRLGMDQEPNSFLAPLLSYANISATTLNTFVWQAVNGNTNNDWLVLQIEQALYFFDANANPIVNAQIGFCLMSSFPTNTAYSFASVDGKLMVVGGINTVAVFDGTVTSGVLTPVLNNLLVRDLWGLQETSGNYENDPTFRDAALSNEHHYNLHNQSWGAQRYDKTGTATDPIQAYFTLLGLQPSNSEQVWPALQYQAVSPGNDPFERIYPNIWNELFGATTQCPKGYFIIDLLNRGASRKVQWDANKAKFPALIGSYVTTHADLTTGGATLVAEFAGRIFYGGFNGNLIDGDTHSPVLTNHILFSQLVKSTSNFFRCYQEGDPTSRDQSDLVDTDGGYLRISGCKKIISMQALGNNLVVLAENGVWSVTGGDTNSGFSATNYKVNKLSNFGALSYSSVITEGDVCYYWSSDGIYTIGKNQYGDLEVKNLSQQTIQSLYQNIPNDSKLNVKAGYDTLRGKVRWIYKTGTRFTPNSQTFELVFDSQLGAWNKNQIMNLADNSTEVFGIFRVAPYHIDPTDLTSDTSVLKYVVMHSGGSGLYQLQYGFGYYGNQKWSDWASNNGVGVDAKAYCLTGQQTAGDTGVDKQVPYLIMYFRRTEDGVDSSYNPTNPSGCLFRGQWDFSNTINSNKWTPLREAYKYKKPYLPVSLSDPYDTGYEVISSKNKLRGKGKAFSLYFETEPLKDCQVLGWNLTINGNSTT